jgi:hypothetical protein
LSDFGDNSSKGGVGPAEQQLKLDQGIAHGQLDYCFAVELAATAWYGSSADKS